MANKTQLKGRVLQMLLLLCLTLPFQAWAQKQSVTGVITEENGDPVIGATVLEKGTTNGVSTDLDGKFTLNVNPKGTLVVSYVGFATQEIAVKGRSVINLTLKEDTQFLDELVVVGYGMMKKSDMTGAISSVNGDIDIVANEFGTLRFDTVNGDAKLQSCRIKEGKISSVNGKLILGIETNASIRVNTVCGAIKTEINKQKDFIFSSIPGSQMRFQVQIQNQY